MVLCSLVNNSPFKILCKTIQKSALDKIFMRISDKNTYFLNKMHAFIPYEEVPFFPFTTFGSLNEMSFALLFP